MPDTRPCVVGPESAPLMDAVEEPPGLRPSMGSVGDACDDALCESLLAALGCGLLARRRFASQS